MAECPFCGSEVEEDLIVLGGTCPSCFGSIPGEEAPTDPGEDVKRKQEAADRRGLRIRALLRAAVVALLLGVVLLVALVLVLLPEKELPVIDFDDAEYYQPTELVAYEGPEQPEPATVARSGSRGEATGGRVGQSLEGFTGPAGDDDLDIASLGTGEEVRAAEYRGTRAGTGDRDIDDLDIQAGGSSGTAGSMTVGQAGIKIERPWTPGVRLTDDAAIIAHVKDVMSHEVPKLTQCYQRYLKQDESLAGRWRLDFTVGADSKVKDIRVTGKDMSHPEFESCLAEKIARWRFNELKADQPIGKTITFRPR